MRIHLLSLLGAAVLADCACVAAPEELLGRGGVTFDFTAVSARRFKMDVAPADNLVKGEVDGALGKRIAVELPDAKGGEYGLSCRYRLKVPSDYRHEAHGNGGCRVFFDDKKGPYQHFLLPSADWQDWFSVLKVPVGTKTVGLEFVAGKGCELAFKDLAFVRRRAKFPVEISQTVLGGVDGSFAVSLGQPGMVMFTWRKTADTEFDQKALSIRLTLPKGVEFVDCSEMKPGSLRIERGADGSSRIAFEKDARRPIGAESHYWSQRGLLVRGAADAKPGTALGTGVFEVLEKGRVLGSMEINFLAVDPIAKVTKPKRYFNGFDFAEVTPCRLADRKNAVAYLKSLSDFGADGAIYESHGRQDNELFREGGFSHLVPRQNVAINGYLFMGWRDGPPEDIRYVPYPDYGDGNLKTRGLCPRAVYGEFEPFRTIVLPQLKRILDGADGMWSNWEPCHYTGCFCDHCRRAFEKYIGVPADSLKDEWPAGTVKSRKREVDEFHAQEHAKLIRTIDRYVREYTGGERSLGFIPGVEWADMSSCWKDENLAASYRPWAYAKDLKWIEPWGPYGFTWATHRPYQYVKSRAMAMFWGAADLRAEFDRMCPDGKCPKLMAYPHGVQNTWILQPEIVGIQLDSCFFNRWESSMLYFFPLGCDARYWRSFAEATARAAKYEDFVFDGRETTKSVSAKAVREFAAPCSYGTRYVPASANASLLQVRAFDRNGSRIVAALNFWEKGEAFFRLRAADLPAGSYDVIDETGVLYAKDGKSESWTAEELAAGVLLQVGAMRTRVFEIVPSDKRKGSVRAKITAAEMRCAYETRKAELEKEAAKDREWEKANPTPPRDWMPMV